MGAENFDGIGEIFSFYEMIGVTDILESAPVIKMAADFSVPPLSVMPALKTITPEPASAVLGSAEARIEAERLAAAASTLEELASAIATFQGLSIRRTATSMVFSDGRPQSRLMVIGDTPGDEDDLRGSPFAGQSGQLLDRALNAIGFDRRSDDPATSFYAATVLNWRPPGNRTPTQAEIDISLPFIRRHIALAEPKALLLLGGSAKTLLGRTDTLIKRRGRWENYRSPNGSDIPCMTSLTPSMLIKNPLQKKLFWHDCLLLKIRLAEISSQ